MDSPVSIPVPAPVSIPVPAPLPTLEFDRENAFQLYATFCGDLQRTAAALNVRPVDVLRVVDEEGWNDRLKDIIALKNSARPGDVERAMNRAYNYVQARRFQIVVERIITRLYNFDREEMEDYIFQNASKRTTGAAEESTRKLTTRALADLASALEKAQVLSYMALNDTTQERVKRNEKPDGDSSALELHQQIAAAMAKVRASNTPRAALFDAQLAVGQQLVAEATKPTNPHDDDDH
jgi:hypothetical protein